VGITIKELIQDMRKVMSPFTAINLKESKNNTLKDFVHVSGPLGVTHFLMFSATEVASYLRICKVPRGPTLTFRIHSYTLMSDIYKLQQHPHSPGVEYKTPPLLILNNFGSDENHIKLMAVTFQKMLPPINIHTTKLDDCKRVVLFHFDKETKRIAFRHYLITTTPVGLSKSVKRVLQFRVSNLDQYQDISEYILEGTGAAESDLEEGPESHVEVPNKVPKVGVQKTQSAVRLQELGPRMELQLIKIEAGLCDGTVLFHEYVHKTPEEIALLQQRKEAQKALKEARRREQERRVQEKKALEEIRKTKKKASLDDTNEATMQQQQSNDENVEWYRKEVGEEPTSAELAILQSANKDENRVKFHPFSHRKKRKKSANTNDDENDTKSNSDEKPKKKRIKSYRASSLSPCKKKGTVLKSEWKPVHRKKK
jgi:ribosome biogenesis protein SSF1/2